MIFKRVGDVRPYPDHGYVQKQWAAIAPHQVRLDQLVTTKRTLDLEALLEEDSTFYGDLFAHVVSWRGELYLEDGRMRFAINVDAAERAGLRLSSRLLGLARITRTADVP